MTSMQGNHRYSERIPQALVPNTECHTDSVPEQSAALERSLLLFSHEVRSDSVWPHALQHAGLPVPHHLLVFAQVQVHWVGGAIQPSHPPSSPSPHALSLSQDRGLFQLFGCSHRWPKYCSLSFSIVLPWVFRVDFLKDSLLFSPCCPRDSQESSPTPQCHCEAAILQ